MCDGSRLRRSTRRIRECDDVKPDKLVRNLSRCSERLKLNPVKIEPDRSDSDADNSCVQSSSSSSSMTPFVNSEKLPEVEVVIEHEDTAGSGLTPATVGDFIEKLAEKEQTIAKLADDKEQMEKKAHLEVALLKKEVTTLKQRLGSGVKRPKTEVTTPTSLPYSAKMAARIAKTQKEAVAPESPDDSPDSSSDVSESEPEDDPYDEAFTHGKGMPRGLWEHGRMNAFGKRPRRKCARAKEASRKSGRATRSRATRQTSDAATSSTSHESSCTAKSSATSVVKSAAPSAPADAPTQRFQEFLVSKDLVDDYLEYSTTISTSRKDFLRNQDLLKEWIAFNP
ncbi:hypothetical protein AAVH_20723 [Aphelenchoides avenae]|nr:hypothetical protein AAVH_20723 [Aphelenchus avenae]